MRRINIFVLLCVLVFTMSACAWADNIVFKAANLVDDPSSGSDTNITDQVSGYKAERTDTNGNGSQSSPYVIKITGTGLPAHHNGQHTLGYWAGITLFYNNNNTTYTYNQGWGNIPNTDNNSSLTYSNADAYGTSSGETDTSLNGKTYYTIYWGLYNTETSTASTSDADDTKIAYLIEKKADNNFTYYKIDFSGVTLATPKVTVTPSNLAIPVQTTTTENENDSDTGNNDNGNNSSTNNSANAAADDEDGDEQKFTVTLDCSKSDLSYNVSAQQASTASSGITYSYQWYEATSPTADGTAIDSATSKTYTPTAPTTAGTKYYYCEVTTTLTYSSGTSNGKKAELKVKSNVVTVNKPTSSGGTNPGTGGGSGGGTGTDTETETTTTDQAAEQLVENMDETVANSDAGKAMTEALQSGSQETKEAAVDVVSTLNDTLSTEEIAQLTTEEIQSAVTNKTEEKKDAAAEAVSGVVSDTTKPAGTDLIAKSETASEALKTANENLSVQPKVVTPTAATPEETEKTAQNLANVNESNLNDKDVDLDTVQAASENLKSAEDIEIDNADNDVALQAQKVEAVFDEVSENLAKAPNAGGGSGVVIASVLSRMRPTSTGFFQIKINLRNLTPGRKLKFWPSVAYFNAYVESRANSNSAQKASLADVSLASSEGDAFFLDASGNPVTKVAGNAANMSVVPYLEGGKDYTTAFITADATESDKAALEALASSQETTTEKSSSSSSSGGCELGLGLGALAAFMAFMKTSKKR